MKISRSKALVLGLWVEVSHVDSRPKLLSFYNPGKFVTGKAYVFIRVGERWDMYIFEGVEGGMKVGKRFIPEKLLKMQFGVSKNKIQNMLTLNLMGFSCVLYYYLLVKEFGIYPNLHGDCFLLANEVPSNFDTQLNLEDLVKKYMGFEHDFNYQGVTIRGSCPLTHKFKDGNGNDILARSLRLGDVVSYDGKRQVLGITLNDDLTRVMFIFSRVQVPFIDLSKDNIHYQAVLHLATKAFFVWNLFTNLRDGHYFYQQDYYFKMNYYQLLKLVMISVKFKECILEIDGTRLKEVESLLLSQVNEIGDKIEKIVGYKIPFQTKKEQSHLLYEILNLEPIASRGSYKTQSVSDRTLRLLAHSVVYDLINYRELVKALRLLTSLIKETNRQAKTIVTEFNFIGKEKSLSLVDLPYLKYKEYLSIISVKIPSEYKGKRLVAVTLTDEDFMTVVQTYFLNRQDNKGLQLFYKRFLNKRLSNPVQEYVKMLHKLLGTDLIEEVLAFFSNEQKKEINEFRKYYNPIFLDVLANIAKKYERVGIVSSVSKRLYRMTNQPKKAPKDFYTNLNYDSSCELAEHLAMLFNQYISSSVLDLIRVYICALHAKQNIIPIFTFNRTFLFCSDTLPSEVQNKNVLEVFLEQNEKPSLKYCLNYAKKDFSYKERFLLSDLSVVN